MTEKHYLVINPNCHQGKGRERWQSISTTVKKQLPASVIEMVLENGLTLEKDLLPLLRSNNVHYIYSAGGDGGIHYLVNLLMKSPDINLDHVHLGAIGLGSSNDFLKPVFEKINDIPVRIQYKNGSLKSDVGKVEYKDKNGNELCEYFIINASMGVTATANYNFNHPDKLLRYLKSNFTSLAIVYAALKTIFTYKNINCKLSFNKKVIDSPVANINLLKIPYVSGSFHYSDHLRPDDGDLGLHICLDINKWELLQVLYRLAKGIFTNSPKTLSDRVSSFEISSDEPIIFECDGETFQSEQIHVSLIPSAIKLIKIDHHESPHY
ncbi:MAG: diacylglycerol/lipid kinase family protein [Saprospiraceae bacterium]